MSLRWGRSPRRPRPPRRPEPRESCDLICVFIMVELCCSAREAHTRCTDRPAARRPRIGTRWHRLRKNFAERCRRLAAALRVLPSPRHGGGFKRLASGMAWPIGGREWRKDSPSRSEHWLGEKQARLRPRLPPCTRRTDKGRWRWRQGERWGSSTLGEQVLPEAKKTSNIQHPTSNEEHRSGICPLNVGCWMLDVGCFPRTCPPRVSPLTTHA